MVIRYLWPAFTWSAIILVLTLMPGDALPEVDIFQVDKLVHFFIFGVFMILMSYGLSNLEIRTSRPAKPLLIAACYSVALGIIIEFIQRYVPGRSFSIADMLANGIGALLGYLIFLPFKKQFTQPDPKRK